MAISNKDLSKRLIAAFEVSTLKEVAAIIGEPYTSLHNWAASRRDFPVAVLIRIANMAKISINWLLTGEGEMRPEKGNAAFDEALRAKAASLLKGDIKAWIAEEIGKQIEEQIQLRMIPITEANKKLNPEFEEIPAEEIKAGKKKK